MILLGVLLVLAGFIVVTPRGATPGSAAIRNIDLDLQGVHETPGYQQRIVARRKTVIRIAIGVALLVGGVAIIALGS